MLILVAEIGTSKSTNLIFHVIFFDISVTTLDITMIFFVYGYHDIPVLKKIVII